MYFSFFLGEGGWLGVLDVPLAAGLGCCLTGRWWNHDVVPVVLGSFQRQQE